MKPPATELKVEQGTEEWLEARVGRATSSRNGDILATIRSGESAARRNYRAELVAERLTGQPFERYRTLAMEFGSDTEELARVEYQLRYEQDVRESGIFLHDKIQAGGSPDGLIADDGIIEIKCRNIANHLTSLHTGEAPKEYIPQIQGNLWMTGRAWADYISFAPEFPPNAQLFVIRIMRDQNYIDALEQEVKRFLAEVDEEVEFVKNYGSKPAKVAK